MPDGLRTAPGPFLILKTQKNVFDKKRLQDYDNYRK
jgi:hypothetical protein